MADVVFQRVTAFKSMQSNIFVAFLGLFYVSFTVPAKVVTTDISYFGAILLKQLLEFSRLYAMKDGGQKSESLLFATLFGDSYFAAYGVQRGKTSHD